MMSEAESSRPIIRWDILPAIALTDANLDKQIGYSLCLSFRPGQANV